MLHRFVLSLLPDLFRAFALLLVLEGVMPFVAPHAYRRMMRSMSNIKPIVLRVFGLFFMLLGLALLFLYHSGLINLGS